MDTIFRIMKVTTRRMKIKKVIAQENRPGVGRDMMLSITNPVGFFRKAIYIYYVDKILFK